MEVGGPAKPPQAGLRVPVASSSRRAQLQRVLGWTFGLAITLGNMFGTGILTQPGRVAQALGSPLLILAFWLAGGLFAFFGVLCLLELAAMFPLEGGPYVFAQRAFGNGMGFVVGWNDLIGLCAAMAYESYAFASYLNELAGHRLNVKAIALLLLGLLFALQALGSRHSSQFESAMCIVNALALFVLIASCFVLQRHSALSYTVPFEPILHRAGFMAVVIALQGVFLTYDGWQSGIYFSEEQKDPNLTASLKSAMITGVAIATGLFILTNLALLKALPLEVLARSSDLPFPQTAQSLFGTNGRYVCLALALLVMPPAINEALMLSGRVLFAMSRDHLFWSRAAAVTSNGSPLVATALVVTLAGVLILLKSFDQITELAVFVFVANYIFSFASLIAFRTREPHRMRPYKMWGYPWTIAAVLMLALLYLAGALRIHHRNALYALALELTAIPVFLLIRRLNRQRGLQAAGPGIASSAGASD